MVYKCSVVTNFILEFVDISGWPIHRNKYLHRRIMKPSMSNCANHDKLSFAPHNKVPMQRNCVTLQYIKTPYYDSRCGTTSAMTDTVMMTSSVSEQTRGLYSSFIENSGLLECDALSLS